MTNKVRTALGRVQTTLVRYTELRVQAVRDEQIILDQLAEVLFRADDLLDRLEYRLNSEATATRRFMKENENGN